jgi:hypothetical protein
METKIFFPQASVDQWGIEGIVELTPSELVMVAEGRRFSIAEAVRVLVEVTGSPDPHGIVGKVRTRASLEALGAEIFEGSMVLGDNAYDVVEGWMGSLVPGARVPETSEPSVEALLARFLTKEGAHS